MIPVLSRTQMRAFDAHAIQTSRVPSIVLMENAGRGAADVIERELLGGRAAGRRIVVVCGAGNNGGDGFGVARHLLARGAQVEAWSPAFHSASRSMTSAMPSLVRTSSSTRFSARGSIARSSSRSRVSFGR